MFQLSTADIQVEGISQAPSFFKNEETSAGQVVDNWPILQDSDGPWPNMVQSQESTTSDVLSIITTEAFFYKTTRSKLMTSQTPSVSTASLQAQAEISYLETATPKQSVLMTSQSPSASSELLNTQREIPYFQATATTWLNFPTSQTQRPFYALSTVNTALPLSFLQPPSIVTEVTDSVLDSDHASTTSIVTETLTSSVNREFFYKIFISCAFANPFTKALVVHIYLFMQGLCLISVYFPDYLSSVNRPFKSPHTLTTFM